jgi:hypothetical protein
MLYKSIAVTVQTTVTIVTMCWKSDRQTDMDRFIKLKEHLQSPLHTYTLQIRCVNIQTQEFNKKFSMNEFISLQVWMFSNKT